MTYRLLAQTRPTNCGQTVMAMLTGKSIRDMEKYYGHATLTFLNEHVKAANDHGFHADGFKDFNGETLPALALVRIAFLKRSGGKYSTTGKVKRNGHLVLWANGVFMDPDGGRTYSMVGMARRITHACEVLAP